VDVSSTPAPLLAIELPLPNTTVFVSGTVTPLVISTTPVPAGSRFMLAFELTVSILLPTIFISVPTSVFVPVVVTLPTVMLLVVVAPQSVTKSKVSVSAVR